MEDKTDENLLTEGREAGIRYIARFGGDWKALVEDLNLRSRREGRKVYQPLADAVISEIKDEKPEPASAGGGGGGMY